MRNISVFLLFFTFSLGSHTSYSQLELEYEDLYIEYDESLEIQSIRNFIMVNITTDTSLYFHWEVGLDSVYQNYLDQGLLELPIADFNLSYSHFISSSCMVENPNEIEPEQSLNQIILDANIITPELWTDDKVSGFFRLLDLSCNEEITSMRFHIGNDLTSTADIEDNSSQVFPNPTSGVVYIESQNDVQSILVKDIRGMQLLESFTTNQIDISSLPNGIYFLQVAFGSQQSTHKVIKN